MNQKAIEVPVGLRRVLESGNGVLFVGAGIGWSTYRDERPMPDARALAEELSEEFKIEVEGEGNISLAKVAQLVEIRKGREKLIAYLSKRLHGFEPNEQLRWLFSLRWKAIFTTNYDSVIERCYELNPRPVQNAVSISAARNIAIDSRLDVPIYHLHGHLFDGGNSQILITRKDYIDFAERRRMLFELLKIECGSSNIVYVGYSNEDSNWESVISEVRKEFSPAKPPPSFRIAKSTSLVDRELLEAEGVATLDATVDAFVAAASPVIDGKSKDPISLEPLRESIPADLQTAFRENPAATVRLLSSWEYVNQADINSEPNLHPFLEGYEPNWSLMASKIYFSRDVVHQLLDALLDFATSPNPRTRQLALIGSAGFGVTTALMSAAMEVVTEKAAKVFWLKQGNIVSPGDIEFACSISDSPPIFVIDNAADHASGIRTLVGQLQASNLVALVLLGERVNEFRSATPSIKATEYVIDPLSDDEVVGLLKFLEKNGALGELKELSPELRFAAVKKKHDRQLLVAMMELTKGPAFSAIIESEYRGISTEFAKRVYAVTACAFAGRKLLRDSLLAEVMGIHVEEMHRSIKSELDGVVDFFCVNQANGLYAARCRHHRIAETVWERCVSPAERSEVLQSLLRNLNVNYPQDAQLFESLVRDDRQVDGLQTFEEKVAFFEWACKKDPGSPYVRQHYARMLLRETKYELALGQVEEGIRISPNTRVLYHTKGIIFREMAFSSGVELGRRRLAQAEETFRAAIARDSRDTYSYQSLAELYLGWAKRCDDEDERASYLGKCEETLQRGLIEAHHREDLWVVSARVQQWIGDDPGAIAALTRAGASPVAKYLLGRTYFELKRYPEAKELLEGLLAEDPNQYRAAICYSKTLLALGEGYASAVAPLRLSELYGTRYPEFIALLGGLLYLEGEYGQAKELFEKSKGAKFPVEERRRRWYEPTEVGRPDAPLVLQGVIGAEKPGYLWLTVPGHPNGVFAPQTRIKGTPARKGERVAFQLCFNADGPVGVGLELVN